MVRTLVQDHATFRADLPHDAVEQGGENDGWAFEVPVESVMVWCDH